MNTSAVKLQVRMDRSLKDEADSIFEQMGLDATTAVRIFFTKVVQTRSLPFRMIADPEFTEEQEKAILQAWEESKNPANLSGPFSSEQELTDHLETTAFSNQANE